MRWTYDKVRRYAECQRKRASRVGCRTCGKICVALELMGTPPLGRMTRDGYGIERIKEAMSTRGWYCRGCSRGNSKEGEEKKKQKQQKLQCSEPGTPHVSLEDKRLWTDERKFEYCLLGKYPVLRARECWEEGPLLDEALEILRKPR